MRRAGLAAVVLVTATFAVPAAASDSQLEELLLEVESILAEDSPSRLAFEEAGDRVAAAVSEAAAGAPLDLLRRLAVEVELLATSPAADPARRRELLGGVEATLDLLRQKLGRPTTGRARPAAAFLPPAHDACVDAILLSDGTIEGDTGGATPDGGASCGDSSASPDVWYAYTAATTGLVTFSTFGSSLDTVLSLHSACPDGGGDHESACNDDSRGTLGSLVARELEAGETVLLRVSGAAGASGSFRLTVDPSAGGIAGTVTKAGTGEPRAEASVRLFRDSGSFVGEISAGADGSYLFGGLDAGDFYAQAIDPTLIREVWDDHPCAGTCNPVDIGDAISVASGLVEGVDFALAAGGTIEGAITDADGGSPLFGSVRAYDGAGAFVASDSTDSSGAYAVGGLPAGSYTVRTSVNFYLDELYEGFPCEPGCDETAGTPVAVAAGSSAGDVDFVLSRLGSLSGSVTSATDGTPARPSSVLVYDAAGTFVASGSTGFDGGYEVTRLVPGDYFAQAAGSGFVGRLYDGLVCDPSCDVTAGTPIAVALAGETAGIDFSLDPLGRIEGSVVAADSGLGLPGQVLLYRADGSLQSSRALSQGRYDFSALQPGTYYVRTATSSTAHENQLFHEIGCDPGCDPTQGHPVSVALATITSGVDFSLVRCSADSHVVVSNLHLLGSQAREACRTIVAGPNVTIAETGELTLSAGRAVALASGFRVLAGGRLAVAVDPAVGSD